MFAKHARDEARRLERLAEEMKVAEKLVEERKAKDELRLERLRNMREEQVMKVVRFEKQLIERSKYIHIVRAEEAAQRAVIRTQKELDLQDKKDKVRQLARMKEYKRERTLRTLDVAEKRLAKTFKQKQDLIDERKAAAIGVARRKWQMKKSMDLIRTSGKWDLIDCLNEDGSISKAKRQKQLRRQRRERAKGGGDDDAGSPRSP